jgi:hypothetical protein
MQGVSVDLNKQRVYGFYDVVVQLYDQENNSIYKNTLTHIDSSTAYVVDKIVLSSLNLIQKPTRLSIIDNTNYSIVPPIPILKLLLEVEGTQLYLTFSDSKRDAKMRGRTIDISIPPTRRMELIMDRKSMNI